MFSNRFNISLDDSDFCVNLLNTYSDPFSLNLEGRDRMNVLDEYKEKISTLQFKNDSCVYQYSFFGKPLYIGISTNGHVNRFNKQIRTLFERDYNRKSPNLGLVNGNIREPWIEKWHKKGLSINGVTLQILSLEKDNIGDHNYDRILELSYHHGGSISFYEQILLNYYHMTGNSSYLLNSSKPTRLSWLDVKTDSIFVKDLRNMFGSNTIENFIA
jgi:hypothetical protein